MKGYLFIILILLSGFSLYSQENFTHCSDSTRVNGEDRALDGGAYKPSANAPGEYFRALVVYVQFAGDQTYKAGWNLGSLPNWAYQVFDTDPNPIYTEGTISDYFKLMSNGDFDFIANVHPNLIVLPEFESFGNANLEVLDSLNNQISDFTIYDNWKLENQEFVFSPCDGDTYLDMIIIVYRYGDENFGIPGGSATLGFNGTFTTHDNIKIHSSSIINHFCSGITTQVGYPLTFHLAHEYGHYLFGSGHAYYGLMTGALGYYGGTGAMNAWERKKLGYINYLEASYNGITKTLADYVTEDDVLRITIPFNTPSSSEYYLIENHQKESIYDKIISGGEAYYNPDLGNGIYVWKIVGDNYPPLIRAVTADGKFNWQYVGDFYAGPGWYVDKPWEGWLPKTIRTSVNRYTGKNDRNPDHVYWNNHMASKWVDDRVTHIWTITRNVMGDEYDAFNMYYNELLSPWSNPSTSEVVNGRIEPTNISLQLVY